MPVQAVEQDHDRVPWHPDVFDHARIVPHPTCRPEPAGPPSAGAGRASAELAGREDGGMGRYVWIKDDPPGMEQAELTIADGGLVAKSVALGSVPVPYRLDLELTTGADWVTRRWR